MKSECVKPGRVNGRALLRAIYDLSAPDDHWMRQVLIALRPAVPTAVGVHGTTYSVTPPNQLAFSASVALDGAQPSVAGFVNYSRRMNPRLGRQVAARSPVSVASQTGLESFAELKKICFDPCGAADSLNVNQFDGDTGINVGFMLPRTVGVSETEAQFLHFVARHLSAALVAREALRAIKDGTTPWAESSLADRLRAGGLTDRERDVWIRRERGETPKEIAFSLSRSFSTVRLLLARADRKMGRRPLASSARP